jgi:transcriptional regulator with XRE-family HTH domain
LKLTQSEFAKKLGVPMRTYQDWEYGESSIKEASLKLIESTFNVNPTWLREGHGEMLAVPDPDDVSDFKLMESVIAETLRGFETVNIKLPPEKTAETIMYLYKTIMDENQKNQKIVQMQKHLDKVFNLLKITHITPEDVLDSLNNGYDFIKSEQV